MKDEILRLRSLGYSYNKIVGELGCSKGTIAYHCGDGQREKARIRTRNHRAGVRVKKVKKNICSCGGKKYYKAKTCHSCKLKRSFDKQMNRDLDDVALSGNARIKWSHLRRLAHKYMELLKVEKKCEECGFDVVVELCHIKPISGFPSYTLVKEVNARSNLKYLCPNHHAMLDKGIM